MQLWERLNISSAFLFRESVCVSPTPPPPSCWCKPLHGAVKHIGLYSSLWVVIHYVAVSMTVIFFFFFFKDYCYHQDQSCLFNDLISIHCDIPLERWQTFSAALSQTHINLKTFIPRSCLFSMHHLVNIRKSHRLRVLYSSKIETEFFFFFKGSGFTDVISIESVMLKPPPGSLLL